MNELDIAGVNPIEGTKALKGLLEVLNGVKRDKLYTLIKDLKESEEDNAQMWLIGEYLERGITIIDAINEEADDE